MPPLYARQHVLVLAHLSGLSRCPHEAYLPTQQLASQAHSRFSRAHGHPCRTSGARPPSRQGPQASHCLSGGFAAARASVHLPTCQPRPDRFNRRNVSGINPNSIASTGTRAAPPTPVSRSSYATAAARFQDLDYPSPHASSVTPCGVTASSDWFGNHFVSINMNCRRWTLWSMRVQAPAMRTTPRSRAASKSIGARL